MFKISAALTLLVSIFLNGCVRRHGRNSDCKWPKEPDVRPLYTDQPDYAEHLREDVELAEELAVRYMDAHHGLRSGESRQAAGQALNGCLGHLLEQIGTSHHVPTKEVLKFLGRRSIETDLAVNLPFFVLYSFFSAAFAGQLLRRYPPEDGWTAALALMILSSVVFGIGAVILGGQWSMLAENIRIGTGHLSYRVERLPWERHRIGMLALCVALFCGAAVARYWTRKNFRNGSRSGDSLRSLFSS